MTGSVRKRGDKWYYSFEAARVDGKRKRIERVGGKTKKEAEAALRKALEEYENTGRHFTPSNLSLSDYLDYWFTEYVEINCRYNTIYSYKMTLNKHVKPKLGQYKLSTITTTTIQEFINYKYEEGLSRVNLSNILKVLGSALRYAIHPCDFLRSDPTQHVKIPKFAKDTQYDKRILSSSDIERIFERFPQTSYYHIPIMIGYHTGMRIGEVMGLTWDDVDLENNTISVNKTLISKPPNWVLSPPKTTSSNRIIAIGDTLTSLLKKHRISQKQNKLCYGSYYDNQYRNNDGSIITTSRLLDKPVLDFVCTKPSGGFLKTKSFKYVSHVINHGLGIKFNFHSLRHTHATLLVENGANIKDVQRRLGHANIRVTLDTYTHVTPKMSRQTVEIFESLSTR